MLLLSIKIILLRICDVSLNTIRTMMIVKRKKIMASSIAFFEILIWYYAVKIAITSTDNSIIVALSYAFGYAIGTFIGTNINDLYFKENT